MNDRYDVLIIGGGPGGLAAGLWLARYRRRVRVVDAGAPRNRPTWAVHGYPVLPDMPPEELRRRFREQALGAGADLAQGRVTAAEGERDDETSVKGVFAAGDITGPPFLASSAAAAGVRAALALHRSLLPQHWHF